MIMYTH